MMGVVNIRKRSYEISDMYCIKCRFHTTVPRPKSRRRKKGHLKWMWCPRCKKKMNFLERRLSDY